MMRRNPSVIATTIGLLLAAFTLLPAAVNVKTVGGVPIANVKTVGGVAKANVKSIGGVDNTGGGGTPAWVQDDGGENDPFNAARSVTFGSSTTSGNCIVAIYQGSNASTLVCTAPNVTFETAVDGATSGIAIALGQITTGQASHQVTFTVTSHSNPGRMIIMEFSGVATSSAVDDSDQESGFVANSSIDLTTTVNNTMLVGAMKSGTGGATEGSGFTLRHDQTTLQTETKVGATSGTNAVGFVHSERTASISAIALKPN